MSYTFGAGTGDDITGSGPFSYGADNGTCLVCGWWYPTTLTATRGYWSCGNIFGAEIDATTSEIRMRTDNTTDGQWLTSGAGITTNKWWFIAWLSATENTTVAGAWRVWVGDAENPPAEKTVTNPTARNGNYTGNANMYAGNKGTGTLAFQGDIGWVCWLGTSTVGVHNPFAIATSGAIDQAQADATYRRWVLPFWLGNPRVQDFVTAGESAAFGITHFSLDNPAKFTYSSTTTPGAPALTVNGATYSSNFPPTRPRPDWCNQAQRVRR